MKKLVKKNKINVSKAQSPNVTPIFDSSVPLSFKNIGSIQSQEKHIRLHTNANTSLSPYIIRLSRETAKMETRTHQEKLDALAKQIASFQDELNLDESPVYKQINAPLTVTHADFIHQFTESDISQTHPKIQGATTEVAPEVDEPFIYKLDSPEVIEISDFFVAEPIIQTENTQPNKSTFSWTEWFSPHICRVSVLLPKQARHRAIASFLALSFLLIAPLQAMQGLSKTQNTRADVQNAGQNAVSHIMSGFSAISSDKLSVASTDFSRASQNFAEAQESLSGLQISVVALVNLIPQTNRTFESVNSLVSAGKELSSSASLITQGIEEVSNTASIDIIVKLQILREYIQTALPHMQIASEKLKIVDIDIIPTDQHDTIVKLINTAPEIVSSMQEFLTFSDALILMLGGEGKMRYLLTFQNNTELRATGGFTGSFAKIDISHGAIENLSIPGGGTYDIQGQLTEFVAAPEPLQLINPRWEFHDANWFPDFPSSAKKMLWFYQKAGGATTDGLIAFNASILPKILEITGPIAMPKYGRTIDSENVLFETQKIVEFEYSAYENKTTKTENAPKQFIADLAPLLISTLQNANATQLMDIVGVIGNALGEKDIQVYFTDNQLQNTIEELGWSGSMTPTSGDYLMVVSSNLGGGKTDAIISQQINLKVKIEENGEIYNTVSIEKQHHGLADSLFESKNNVDYIRLYVPQGSELFEGVGFEIPANNLFEESPILLNQDEDLSLMMSGLNTDIATGTDIWEESGKTVFGNWIQTAPGETQTVTFTYKLPFSYSRPDQESLFEIAKTRLGLRDLQPYTLLLQKQSGVETRDITVSMTIPPWLKAVFMSDNELFTESGSVQTQKTDNIIQALFEAQQ